MACALYGGAAYAQEAQPAAPDGTDQTPPQPTAPGTTPTQEQAPAPPPSGDAPPVEAAPAEGARTVEDRLTELEGKIEGINEPFLQMQSDVTSLKRLKISGYVQGRYEWHDDNDYGVNPANSAPRALNRFYVRRGRVKTTYVGDLSEFVLQIDAIGTGVSLRDAEASLVLDNTVIPGPTPWELKLTVGQFKIPFGFEVLQSSGDRELPERARVITQLFPGERDRGLRLAFTYDWLKFSGAIINGNFTNDAIYNHFDQTSFKDLVGRLGADFEFLVIGASVHWGHTLRTTLGRAASGTMPAVPPMYQNFSRLRVGGDAQLYLDIPALGGFSLRGEAIWAKDERIEFMDVSPMNACADTNGFGWIGTVVQNVGQYVGVVFRVDQFDPNRDVAMACTQAIRDAAASDKRTNYAFGLLGYISGNLKATFAYDHTVEQGANKIDNDTFTAQLQAKF